MCLSHEMIKLRSPKSRRFQREQLLRPRLSRKIVASARVNLNLHWAKFEEVTQIAELARKNQRNCLDNEINENLVNEIRELGN